MQWMAFVFPVLYAVFLWWFTTGLIIVVYDRSRWLTQLCYAGMTMGMMLAVLAFVATRNMTDMNAILIALTCGVVIWGWQVAGYYLNFVTGESADVTDDNQLSLRHRFWLALNSGIHHELMALVFAIGMIILTWSSPNKWGMWVYVALWLMHASAKLNVFFGVRNFHIEFLPQHLHHIERLLEHRQYNAFFPFSVVVASSVVLVLFFRAVYPPIVETQSAGYLAIATLIALGILEHCLLVLPVPSTLYGWGMRALPKTPDKQGDTIHKVDVVSQSVKGQIP